MPGETLKKMTGAESAFLTSHEEEESSYILHQVVPFAAAQESDDPAKEDDGDCHPDEAGRHPAQVCGGEAEKATTPIRVSY